MADGRAKYERRARTIAKKYGVDPNLFVRLITQESGWNASVTSPAGAIGLGQLMPGTAKGLGVNPLDPIQNMNGAARYLRQQIDAFDGDVRLGLAAYNAGPGAVQRYGGIPPYKETQRYVRKLYRGDESIAPTSAAPVVKPLPGLVQPITPPPSVRGNDLIADQAMTNLTRIAQGERPTDTLGDLVEVSSAAPIEPTPVDPAAPALSPTPPPSTPANPGPAPARAAKPVTPSGGWQGSEGIAKGFHAIGASHGLSVMSEKRPGRDTKSGNRSDHWVESKDSYAFDLSNGSKPTAEMDAAAVEIAAALGVKWKPSDGKLEIYKVVNGYRIQVIYRSQLGGNHNDHVHVGVRRYG